MGPQSDSILIEKFISDHPVEAVRLIENLASEDITRLLEILPGVISAQLIVRMKLASTLICLQSLSVEKAISILENLPMEVIAVLLRNISGNVQKEFLAAISPEKSAYIEQTLTFPEGTVGSVMGPYIYTFFEDQSVSDALKTLKNQSDMNELYIYVVTRNHKLTGVITVNELVRTKSSQLLSEIMKRDIIKIFADVKLNLIQNHPAWFDYSVLPVVDSNDILQGILDYHIVRRFEQDHIKNPIPLHLMKTSSALGELYRIGMTSLLQGASTFYNEPEKES